MTLNDLLNDDRYLTDPDFLHEQVEKNPMILHWLIEFDEMVAPGARELMKGVKNDFII